MILQERKERTPCGGRVSQGLIVINPSKAESANEREWRMENGGFFMKYGGTAGTAMFGLVDGTEVGIEGPQGPFRM